MPRLRRALLLGSLAALLGPAPAPAQPAPEADDARAPYEPRVEPASDEGRLALARFRVPEGLRADLFAAEPLLANPVAFDLDARGRAFVVETFRHSDGVPDIRGHMDWLDDDLASRTVADRVAMYRRYLSPEEFARYGVEHDRIRLVEDRDGDGVAETATVFADGFHSPATGIGAGVLARGADVYFTCIPDLWLLRDEDGDGRAESRLALHSGYGVHNGFIGHDLHGPTLGPDGQLYFSIGDRGLNVTTVDGRRVAVPDTGAVLRCRLDGTGLEVVATGLRNPQELAFDEYGNLFTVDNNSDSGDRARLVWVVDGGDSGWRIGWQFLERPNARGPWNAEKMWHAADPEQPAFLVPPLAHFSDGPGGLAYNPGTALRERDRGRFFLADFRGSSSTSGVRSFAVRPRGAAFELVDQDQFLWGLEATDVGFGPDGALYVSDWVEGWNKTGKGRLYRLSPSDPDPPADALRAEVRTLLAEGMDARPVDELARLLGHADLRVRREAQYALAARGTEGSHEAMIRVARGEGDRLARIHATWGLSHAAKLRFPGVVDALTPLLRDPDAEVRAQALRSLTWAAPATGGAAPADLARSRLVPLLDDESPRVRFFAAQALARLTSPDALDPLLAMARRDGADPYLRHAAVMGLAPFADAALLAHAADPSADVRLAVLLALRRHGSPEVARFLDDADPRLVLEAARAINDLPIAGATARLAALAVGPETPAPLLRRVVNANVRVGGADAARRLAALAAEGGLPVAIRSEALDALASWSRPPGRDRVTGLWRPVPERPAADAAAALASVVDPILDDGPESVRRAAVQAVGALALMSSADRVAALVADESGPSDTRVAALQALDALGDPRLLEVVRRTASGRDRRLRAESLRLLARLDPASALEALAGVLESGTTREVQSAFATVGSMDLPAADALLARWLDRLLAGDVAPEVRLDLLDAASARRAEEVRARLAAYESRRPEGDPVAAYREALHGGDRFRGARIFREKAEVSCLRCHKIRGEGGEVGPELTGIGAKQPREYLLESIVAPNKQIAEGFETQIVATADGQVVAGVVRSDDDETLTLITAEGRVVAIPKADVEERTRGESAMPGDLMEHMSKSELRDLIEFLAGSR